MPIVPEEDRCTIGKNDEAIRCAEIIPGFILLILTALNVKILNNTAK